MDGLRGCACEAWWWPARRHLAVQRMAGLEIGDEERLQALGMSMRQGENSAD